MTVLIRNVEVAGRVCDVRIRGGRVAEIGRGLTAGRQAEVVYGRGGALIPGLHDRHLHVLALAAAARSLDLAQVRTPGQMAAALGNTAERTGGATLPWLRAVGYHESIAGRLDRWALDRLAGERPTRVQHRSGALWILNSAALRLIRLDDSMDIERDARGEPTGRLWRYDERLRHQLPKQAPDVHALGSRLTRYGITSITDATPDTDAPAVRAIAELPQHVTFLGASAPVPEGSLLGPRKIMLRDHDLPDYEQLRQLVLAARHENRAVAVHCVTRVSVLLTLAVLDDVGRWPQDRIEHAAVVPDPALLSGLTVVTQPAFVSTRGDDYVRDVEPDDVPHLYPFASLLDAGVRVHASSDAPFGPLDPWEVIRAARDRTTCSGAVLGAAERVSARTALTSYWSQPRIAPGMRADLCLLGAPMAEVLREPDSSQVQAVWIDGLRQV